MSNLNVKLDLSESEKKFLDDISDYLMNYGNVSYSIDKLSDRTGVSTRTLKRWLVGENSPSKESLCKVYIQILNIDDSRDFLERVPAIVIKEFGIDEYFLKKMTYPIDIQKFISLFKNNSVVRDIYFLLKSSSLNGEIGKNSIFLKFKDYGLTILTTLIEIGIVSDEDGGLRLSDSILSNSEIDLLVIKDLIYREAGGSHSSENNGLTVNSVVAGYSDKGIAKIEALVKKTMNEINILNTNPENMGDKILVSSFTSGSIMSHVEDKNILQ